MDHVELHDALSWLRGAVLVLESGAQADMSPAERAEWEQALEHKRSLLHRLEVLNAHLLKAGMDAQCTGVGRFATHEQASELVA